MARFKNRPACPKCGDQIQRSYTSGWANEETIPVTVVKCLACGYIGVQGLFWLPDEASVNSMDENRRLINRLRKRVARNGNRLTLNTYRDTRVHSKTQRITSDTIDYSFRIVPGSVRQQLKARLPGLKRKRHTITLPMEETA